MRRRSFLTFLLLATLAAAAALRLPSSPLPPSPRASSPRMDAISDVAALLGMTDPDEKKAVVQRLSEERGLDPTGRIEELISQNKVMLFIKGTKAFPQCGFSNTVVRLIEDCTDDFETFDVLSDETVREGIKEYSSWPTIPQIYLGGEFIGGADIAIEMHESGELKDAVAEALAKPVEGGKNEPVWNFAQDNLSG
jgi:monothiol glutaredoxin